MSKSNALENAWLELFFKATTITGIADNTATSALTNLYVSLHTADPGEAGTAITSEATYTGYARVAVARSGSGWTVTANSVSPAANIDFPVCTALTNTITHFGIVSTSSSAGTLYYKGTVTPNISVSAGVTPRLTTASTITED
jgi:hypothetical protein